jgi:hypothetical protein
MSPAIVVEQPVHAPVAAARTPVALTPAARAPVARAASPARATHPQEDELGRHLKQCKAQQTIGFRMAGWLQRIHGVLAPRFVTTATTASALMLLLLMWI